MKRHIPDSLIFDMDGTLWDAVETYSEAWNLFFNRHFLDLKTSKNQLDSLMGMEEDAFLKVMLPDFSHQQRKEYYREVVQIQYDLIDQKGGYIYEGVIDGLKQLSQLYQLFIISNCPKHTIQHFMKYASIESLITDSLAHGQNYRPKHENIKSLIKAHNLSRPLYIGDTDGDRLQSETAGVPFIFMEYGFGNSSKFDLKFESFTDFTEYFMAFHN